MNSANAILSDLLKKYNQPAPRYTSYPPVPHWANADAGLLISALEQSRAPLSVYVHIPFCERLCLYCGCNVVIRKDHSAADAYVDRLIKEIDFVEAAHGRSTNQMHWGGGTPTYLNSSQIMRLFEALSTRFTLAGDGEFSVEIDPRVTTRDHFNTLRRLGFNRLSIGIQDFDSSVQLAVRRFQSYERTREVFDQARAFGFESINADLIYGLPRQTRSSFDKTLDALLELNPDRIAVFSYAHVPSMKRQQRSFEKYLPSETEKLQIFMAAVERLISVGYEQVGMDHFARRSDPLIAASVNGSLHRNFQGYTTHAETHLIGFGVSAISHVGTTFAQNVRNLSEYGDAIASGRLPVFRGYIQSRDDVIRAAVIEECLCSGRITKDAVEKRFNIGFDEYFRPEVAYLETIAHDGLIDSATARQITITPVGRIFVRSIAKAFDAFQSTAIASKAV
jgi:oxygen-independent coproporphyrinogen III oxidase